MLKSEIISIDYVKSEWNLEDPMIKLLGRNMNLKTSGEWASSQLQTNKSWKPNLCDWFKVYMGKNKPLVSFANTKIDLKSNLSIPMVCESAKYYIIGIKNFKFEQGF